MNHVEKMVHMGALKESEAEHLLEEYLEYMETLSESSAERPPPLAERRISEDIPNPLLQANPRIISRIENLMHDVSEREGASALMDTEVAMSA